MEEKCGHGLSFHVTPGWGAAGSGRVFYWLLICVKFSTTSRKRLRGNRSGNYTYTELYNSARSLSLAVGKDRSTSSED